MISADRIISRMRVILSVDMSAKYVQYAGMKSGVLSHSQEKGSGA